MGVVTDRLERLKINANSPDGSVRVKLDRADGITLALRIGTHTEKSLAAQAKAALTSAFTAYDKAIALIRESATGTTEPPAGTPFATRHNAYLSGTDDIHAVGESPHGYVEVEWRGRVDFTVTISPRTLDELGKRELTAEFNGAIRAAARERTRLVMGLYRRIYQQGQYEGE